MGNIMQLKLHDLETFRLFALTENVTETAQIMNISQPAVSQTLRDFERDVGMPLFRKVGRRLQLTAEAKSFLPEIEGFIQHHERLAQRAKALSTGRSGSLSIASIPTLLQSTIPSVVGRLHAERPKVQISIGSYSAAEVVQRVRVGSSDFGLAFLPVRDAQVEIVPLLRTAVTCFMVASNPLARKRAIRPADLVSECVIAQGASTPPGYVLREYFLREKLDDWPSIEANQSHVALGLAEQGFGVALTHPLHVFAGYHTALAAVPFEPRIPLTLAMVLPTENRPVVVDDFIRRLKQLLREGAAKLLERGLCCELLFADEK